MKPPIASKLSLPHLVLLPGLDGSGVFYADLVAALNGHATTTILNYPVDQALPYAQMADHLLPRLPEGDYAIVAESFSGPLAVLLADQAVRKPKALILAAAFARNPFPLIGGLLQMAVGGFLETKPLPVIEGILLRPGDYVMTHKVFDAISELNSDVLTSRIRSVMTCDVRKLLAALDMPCLYLQGAKDKVISSAHGALMQKTARDLTVVRVDTPHFVLQYDVAQTVRDHILPFLKRIT